MRGLEKNYMERGQRNIHVDSMKASAQRADALKIEHKERVIAVNLIFFKSAIFRDFKRFVAIYIMFSTFNIEKEEKKKKKKKI